MTEEATPLAESVFTVEDNRRLETLLSEFPGVLTSKPGWTDIDVHRIDTGEASPVRGPAYRLSPERRQALRSQVTELLKDGRIEPSHSRGPRQ